MIVVETPLRLSFLGAALILTLSFLPTGIIQAQDSDTYLIAANDSSPQFQEQADYICDGVDDGETIQLALDALPSTGGEIILSDGTFKSSSFIRINEISNISILGQGKSTIFEFTSHYVFVLGLGNTSNIELGNFKVISESVGIFVNPRETNTCREIEIHDVTGEGVIILVRLFAWKTGSIVEDVAITDCMVDSPGGHGFAIDDNGGEAYNRNIILERCKVTNAGGEWWPWATGFLVAGGSGTYENITLRDCEAYDSWESGFHCERAATKINVRAVNCIAEGNGRKPNPLYGSGFIGIPIVKKCLAKNNTKWGICDVVVAKRNKVIGNNGGINSLPNARLIRNVVQDDLGRAYTIRSNSRSFRNIAQNVQGGFYIPHYQTGIRSIKDKVIGCEEHAFNTGAYTGDILLYKFLAQDIDRRAINIMDFLDGISIYGGTFVDCGGGKDAFVRGVNYAKDITIAHTSFTVTEGYEQPRSAILLASCTDIKLLHNTFENIDRLYEFYRIPEGEIGWGKTRKEK